MMSLITRFGKMNRLRLKVAMRSARCSPNRCDQAVVQSRKLALAFLAPGRESIARPDGPTAPCIRERHARCRDRVPIPRTRPAQGRRSSPSGNQDRSHASSARGSRRCCFRSASFQLARIEYSCVPPTMVIPGLGLVADHIEIFLHRPEIIREALDILVEADEIEIAIALEARHLLHVGGANAP